MSLNTQISNDVNLSELLFKPKHEYIETSLISNSGCDLPVIANGHFLMGSHFRSLWYRPLNTFTWGYLGANNMDVDEALANIVMGKNPRMRQSCFDTIEQYGPGNWIYEFCSIAQKRVALAQKYSEEGNLAQASHQYRMASRYFAIAAYPNLKGDVLASQAALLCRQAYKKIFNDPKTQGHYSVESFNVRGEKIRGFLHSVDNVSVRPCVVICAPYGTTITDFFVLFERYLYKLGISIFVVDMPGMGEASKILLDANCSDILEGAIEHLKNNVAYVDSSAIGVYGYSMSTNAVARLSILRPELMKAIVLVAPCLHSTFVMHNLLMDMHLCARSSLANRMNLDASNWDAIVPQLQALSLKKQGLLNYGTQVKIPTLAIYLQRDIKYSEDPKLIAQNFKNLDTLSFNNVKVSSFADNVFAQISKFFKAKLL